MKANKRYRRMIAAISVLGASLGLAETLVAAAVPPTIEVRLIEPSLRVYDPRGGEGRVPYTQICFIQASLRDARMNERVLSKTASETCSPEGLARLRLHVDPVAVRQGLRELAITSEEAVLRISVIHAHTFRADHTFATVALPLRATLTGQHFGFDVDDIQEESGENFRLTLSSNVDLQLLR